MPDIVATPLVASSVSAFLNTIGVNTHLLGGEGNAWDELPTATIVGDLKFIGVKTIRDNVYNQLAVTPRLNARYDALAAAGFTFDFTVGSSQSDLQGTLASLDTFALSHPGAIQYVEGPNEIQYNPFTYQGQTGEAAAIAFQNDLNKDVHADPLLKGVQTLDFTGGGQLLGSDQSYEPVLGIADLPNIHVYPALGDPPDWYIAATGDHQYGQNFASPFVTSEAGYNTDPNAGYGVTEDIAAKYTLDLLLDAAKEGSVDTMLYELYDLYSDPSLAVYDDHWGLFYADGTPKPAAIAIHNLVTMLSTDALPDFSSPGTLDVSLSGLPDAGRYWLLQKNSGTFDLVVWSEPALWQSATRSEVSVASTTVSLGFNTTFATAKIYDPLLSSTPTQSLTNVNQLSISLSDHPLVIELARNPISVLLTGGTAPAPVGSGTDPQPQASEPVYRFFNVQDGSHLFTASTTERDSIIQTRPDLIPEGVAFQAFDTSNSSAGMVPVARFFDVTTGTHFYTTSVDERNTIINTRPDLQPEGTAFYAFSSPSPDDAPVWRFFDSSTGTHLYTSSSNERVNILMDRPDMRDEGIAFYVPK